MIRPVILPTAIIHFDMPQHFIYYLRKWGNNDYNTTFKAKIKKLDSIPVFSFNIFSV